jgi:hypothetical protein
MKEFFDSVQTLYWWISVFVVGLGINLLSAYLKPRIDNWLVDSSSWWRSKSRKRIESRERLVKKLSENPNEELLLWLEMISRKIDGIGFIVAGSAVFVMSGVFVVMEHYLAPSVIVRHGALMGAIAGMVMCWLGSIIWMIGMFNNITLFDLQRRKPKIKKESSADSAPPPSSPPSAT